MASYYFGKDVILQWIRDNFPADSTILDVGACDGNWKLMLPEYTNMDAVEIFEPNAEICRPLYRYTFNADISVLQYDHYDLIILADVLEHMDVPTAQKVLRYAWDRCDDLLVALPFLLKQEAIYGNPWEEHIQYDLTAELVKASATDERHSATLSSTYLFLPRAKNSVTARIVTAAREITAIHLTLRERQVAIRDAPKNRKQKKHSGLRQNNPISFSPFSCVFIAPAKINIL